LGDVIPNNAFVKKRKPKMLEAHRLSGVVAQGLSGS